MISNYPLNNIQPALIHELNTQQKKEYDILEREIKHLQQEGGKYVHSSNLEGFELWLESLNNKMSYHDSTQNILFDVEE